MAALWAGKARKESIHTAVVQPAGKGGGGGSAVFIGPENGGAVCRRLRCEAEAGKAKAAVPPVRLVRKPEGGAVLQLRPVAVGREKGKAGAGAVLKVVGFAAGGVLRNGGAAFTEAAAGPVLHEAVFRDHQRQAAIDNGLCRNHLLHIPHLGEAQLKGQAGGGKILAPEIVQSAAVEHVEAEIAGNGQAAVPQQRQVAEVAR